ncbi:DUF5667 domain-containing protein [Paenisporosarcina sp. TG20]|uniref:DUF5667 domain-containing protein n=1 Tax=Paenisporosarcina sp. TG20 TaxID=1211706 RepID=UPI00031F6250|nr:DUF5667 domain-containing protein [Paenisporosarcina sp. TG20]
MSIFKEKVRIVLLAPMMVALLVFIVGVNPSFANTDEATDQSDSAKEIEEVLEEPVLLPGDFFYFFKTLQENIMLALTFDDLKEVELLIGYTTERTLEAIELLEQGEEELANEVFQLAINQQEEALTAYEESLEDGTAEESSMEDGITEEINEEEATEEVIEEENEESKHTELESKFTSNLLALQVALEKVGNPKAKEALAKNVLKDQERLDIKLNEVATEEEEEVEVAETEFDSEEVATEEGLITTDDEEVEEVETDESTETPDTQGSTKSLEGIAIAETKKQEASKKAKEAKEKAPEKAKESKEQAAEKAEEKRQEAEEKAAEAKGKKSKDEEEEEEEEVEEDEEEQESNDKGQKGKK